MFYGFAVAWLVLFACLVALVRREGKIKKELEHLKRMIEDREPR
jgi:CcmD family protein